MSFHYEHFVDWSNASICSRTARLLPRHVVVRALCLFLWSRWLLTIPTIRMKMFIQDIMNTLPVNLHCSHWSCTAALLKKFRFRLRPFVRNYVHLGSFALNHNFMFSYFNFNAMMWVVSLTQISTGKTECCSFWRHPHFSIRRARDLCCRASPGSSLTFFVSSVPIVQTNVPVVCTPDVHNVFLLSRNYQ